MNEFVAVPKNQLYLYYLILAIVYIIFLRNLRPTYLTATIFLLFNKGFPESLIPDYGTAITKIFFVMLLLILLVRAKNRITDKKEVLALLLFIVFSILFFTTYIVYDINLVWGFYQYYKFFLPVLLFFAVKNISFSRDQTLYYAGLIVKLLRFQIVFSIIKLVIIGLRENITGSISNLGGAIGVGYAVMGLILYWVMKNNRIKGKDWWFVFLLLVIPAASGKRAIWLIYPIVIALLIGQRITVQTLKKFAFIVLLVSVIVYVGLRLNPTFNPEGQFWGSFDPKYAYEYVLSYSGVSEEKQQAQYAQGRWGASTAIIEQVIARPLEKESLIGFGRARSGKISEDFVAEEYGLMHGTMVSAIGRMFLQNGWVASLIIIVVFFLMTYTIPDRKVANVIAIYILWDIIFYSGNTINHPIQSVLMVLAIRIITGYNNVVYGYHKSPQSESQTNANNADPSLKLVHERVLHSH
jgi:hypothetical protein